MAINTVTIQMRMGLEADFDPSKMLPGEWAVSTDTRYVRMCFSPGIVLRMATYESFEADMAQIQAILAECKDIKSAIQRIQSEVNAKASLTIEYANAAEKSAKNAKQSEEKAKMYAENAEAVTGVEIATKDRAGVMKGGDNHIAEDGTLEITRRTTDRTLTNSYAGGLKINEIDGASEQAQYSGKNLMPVNYFSGSVYTEYSISLPSGDYYVTAKVTSNDTHATESLMLLNYTDGTQANVFFTRGVRVKQKVTFSKDISSIRFYASNNFANSSNDTFYWEDIMISAEDIDYEPYVGGSPSPSPEYPQPIKSVGDSGSLEIKTVGKNHLKNNIVSKQLTKNGVTMTINDDKSITLNGTCTAWGIQNLNLNDNGDELDGTYYISGASKNAYLQAVLNETGAVVDSGNGTKVTFDKSVGKTKNWIRLIINEGITYNETLYPMLRKCDDSGNPIGDDTYEPYQSNSITIPLSEPLRQYDKIVKQDGVWGVERGTKSVEFDGSSDEGWHYNTTWKYVYTSAIKSSVNIPNSNDDIVNALCDSYRPNTLTNIYYASESYNNQFAVQVVPEGSKGLLCISDQKYTDVDSWLADISNKPITFEYQLATPTFEPFDTDTQIAINSLMTYDGVTYVSTNSEIEPVIEVEYGTSRVGGYTLDALNTAKRNEAQIASLVALTNDLATAMVESEE